MKLTIAIPTYNRCQYLEELVPILLGTIEEINGTQKKIELLISDNASSDETKKYVTSLAKHECLKYFRNENNLGAEANYLSCIEKASGTYVWLFGDDDLINYSGVDRVFKVIEEGDYELIIAKDENYTTGLKYSVSYTSIKEFVDTMSILNPHFILAHTLITSNIFKKSTFNIKLARGFSHTDYSLMYGLMLSLLDVSKKEGLVYVFNDPIIKVRDVRAQFAAHLKKLIRKQADYIDFIGNAYDNEKIRGYGRNFYRIAMIRQAFNNINVVVGKIPFVRDYYRRLRFFLCS